MATFQYVDKNNHLQSVIAANEAEAQAKAQNANPHSGFMVVPDGPIANQQSVQTPQPIPSTGSPYFKGDSALIKIYGDNGYDSNTVWLVDSKDKTLRPFANDQALATFYGMDPVSLGKYINFVGSDIFSEGNALSGFTPLSFDYAINGSGNAKAYTGSSSSLALRYGSPTYNEELEMSMTSGLDGFLDILKNTPGISASMVKSIGNDENLMAFYISALTYGGYTLGDVYKDVKRRDLIEKGDSSLESVLPISPTQNRSQYRSTSGYQAANNLPSLATPSNIGNLSPETLNLPLYSVPDEAFKTLVPVLDPTSDEFWAKMDDATSVIYEAQLQMLDAKTEQEQQAAQTQWELNKKALEKSLGITLSNSAMDAWTQIEGLRDQSSANGIYNSGIMNEKVDEYLKRASERNNLNREAATTKEDQQKMEYYQKFASPTEIAGLDPATAKKWGLTPSDDIKSYFTMENLSALFPKERPEALQALIDQYVDKSGNLYSGLYNRYNVDKYNTQYDPTSGYNTWKSGKVMQDALLSEEEKYKTYTKPDSAFLRYTGEDAAIPKNTGYNASGTVSLSDTAKKAMGGLVNRPSTGTAVTKTPAPKAETPVYTPPAVKPKTETPAPIVTPFKAQPTTPASAIPSWASGIKLPASTQPVAQPAQQTKTNLLTGSGVKNDGFFSGIWNFLTGKK